MKSFGSMSKPKSDTDDLCANQTGEYVDSSENALDIEGWARGKVNVREPNADQEHFLPFSLKRCPRANSKKSSLAAGAKAREEDIGKAFVALVKEKADV